MRHIATISVAAKTPAPAMSTGTILAIVGTILTTVGSLLVAISPFLDKGN